MKRTLTVLFVTLCISVTSVFGVHLNSISGKMFAAEAIVGGGLGIGLLAAAVYAAKDEDGEQEGIRWWAVPILAGGNAGGVILVGELFDAKSENWYLTYPLTYGAAFAVPAITLLAVGEEERAGVGEVIGIAVTAGLVLVFGTPVATAFTYNLVKSPIEEETSAEAGAAIEPYGTLLADNGDGGVPVYGLSVSF
jgi:hypothetical protein